LLSSICMALLMTTAPVQSFSSLRTSCVNPMDIYTGADNLPLPRATYCMTLQTCTGAVFRVIKCNCHAFMTAFCAGAEIEMLLWATHYLTSLSFTRGINDVSWSVQKPSGC